MAAVSDAKATSTDFSEDQKIPLESLSELTGFPVEFIKKELLLEDQELSLADLRGHMLRYLDKTAEEIKAE